LANLLDKFKKNVIGSRNKVSDYTAKLTPSGEFQRVSDLYAILNSWNNILLTPKGSYDHDPEYGSILYKYIFDPADNQTMEAIRNEVKTCLITYDNRATITEIDVKFLKDKKGFAVNIFVDYQNEEGQLSAVIDNMTYFNVGS
jgi:phage baseplate assembly protein W